LCQCVIFFSKSTYFKATNIQYVKPMFQVTWGALLAAFSLSLEHTQVPASSSLLLPYTILPPYLLPPCEYPNFCATVRFPTSCLYFS
jgi:hypothetical protein